MSQPNPELAADLGRLAFQSFVAVADAEEGLGPREVERFLHLVAAIPPSAPVVVSSAMESLRGLYPELWRNYQSGTIDRTPFAVGTAWAAQRVRMSDTDANAFTAFLLGVLEDVVKAGATGLARLGLASNTKSKALDEVRRVLSAIHREAKQAPAGPASAPSSPAAAEPSGLVAHWPAASLVVGSSEGWTRGKTKVRCVRVVPETHDVKSFYFVAEPARLFSYKPGQFATLELPIDGRTVRRSYTISSSPSRPYLLSITVKRVPGGLVSNWLHDNMAPGFEFNLSGPNGDFTCFEAPSDRLLMIAGGSGITPLMSMLRWLSDTASDVDVVFLNFVRSPDDVIFETELLQTSSRMGDRLRLGTIPGRVNRGQRWNGPVGPFSAETVRFYAPDYAQREVFVCGPAPFMDKVKSTLSAFGFPAKRYHQESFGGGAPAKPAATPAAPAPAFSPDARVAIVDGAVMSATPAVPDAPSPFESKAPAAAAPAAPAPAAPAAAPAPRPAPVAAPSGANGSQIVFAKSGKTVKCSHDDVILDVAEANGIAIESQCRAGSCGTCKTMKVEGNVQLDEQQALTDGDIADGWVLACVGHPHGKVVLDL